ncbi:tyrosine-type recombinase/integrase [Neisseria sp. S1]|uniref:tyrosine-type recombinase/integrase n=1 Tax=Neisseria sp. S1 TaxID=3318354 RepID=UPI003A88572E
MKKVTKHLPARMRQKKTSSGRIYYYYDTCESPRKWLPLGSDFLAALKQYADYEREYSDGLLQQINQATTFKYVADRYFAEVVPTKSVASQKDNARELLNLMAFFNDPPAPINEIKPVHIREYLDWRSKTAKVRANREIALFSHIFNKAREWGYTANENPCRGVSRNKEHGRDVYIDDDVFWRVYGQAERHIQFVMLIAYLIGQRVADCLKIKMSDIKDGEIFIQQNKVKTRLRIKIIGILGDVIDSLIKERGDVPHDYLFIYLGSRESLIGKPLTVYMLRGGMDRARAKAKVAKQEFQFRDLRAKAATDKDELQGVEAARELLGHVNQSMTMHYIRNRRGRLTTPTK